MQAVLQVPIESVYADLPVFVVLAVWNLFVLFVISKKVYEFSLKKGRSTSSSMYFFQKDNTFSSRRFNGTASSILRSRTHTASTDGSGACFCNICAA